ncbi:hypothetical protein GCM10011400_11030 [Paraburkholderia caffeinilytica]|uniref:2-methylfumaryl-CoA isomerase n=1 Tax=Paraburkholderia caffeinilytica TaxID=1761016 RepID=A0ABQ1LT94_9BURK|nr:hypothetical protein GCM10011400_11030 [Paraburkholderia caffeinilytica]
MVAATGVDLATEGGRFQARHAIAAVLEPWFAGRTVAEIGERFDGSGVLWGVYRDFQQLIEEDWRCSNDNPMFAPVDQPGVGRVLTPRVSLSFAETPAPAPSVAPMLGENTGDVPGRLLGLTPERVNDLTARGIVERMI